MQFCIDISQKFTKCGNSIKSFGKNVGPVGESGERFFNAVRSHRIAMLQALSAEFERCQQQYLQNVMGQMKSSKYFDYKQDSDSDSDSPEYLKEFSTRYFIRPFFPSFLTFNLLIYLAQNRHNNKCSAKIESLLMKEINRFEMHN